MRFTRFPFTSVILQHLAAFLTVAFTTLLLLLLRDSLSAQVVALLYLLPVMASTALWGLTPGVMAALLAFLAFNYYFLVPYFTFVVHETQDLLTLIIFTIVAVVISQLLGRARDSMKAAASREREATRLYELSMALSGLQDNLTIAQSLAEHTRETFMADRVEVFIEGREEEQPIVLQSTSEGNPPRSSPLLVTAMLTARGKEGEIRLWRKGAGLTSPEERLLQTYASQGALAVERTRLAKSENRARVLEESDRLKSALLSSVSHELRSPLATIKASVTSLRSGAVDWNIEARQELLAFIEEETDQLNLLVGNLLDSSRLETGALIPQKKWNSLRDILNSVLKRTTQMAQKHPINVELPENLPLVPVDFFQIEQVFVNLISNSVKYAPEGSPITIRAKIREEQTLLVQVINHGPGVAEEHLERIFDKFHRVTSADKVTGTGLGLSICKGVLEAHGGRIWAENGQDCFIFNFTLPLTWDGSLPRLPEEQQE